MKEKEKKDIVWNGFSSTTLSSDTLDKDMFLGTTGERAVFLVQCHGGRKIKELSAVPHENEILIFPCTVLYVEHVIITGDITIVDLIEKESIEDFGLLFSK
jgi:hypothetical protein